MKKSGIIILIALIVVTIGYYIIKNFVISNQNDKAKEEQKKEQVITYDNELVYVYVYGAVNKSGVYEVPNSWRLCELLEMLGVEAKADLSNLDLAMKIEDGKTYYIPFISSSIIEVDDTNSLININTANKEELMSLPGIGEVIAERIIKYRKDNHFNSIEDLKNVSGIGDSVFEKIKLLIRV